MTPDHAKVIMEFLASTFDNEAKTTARVLAAMPEGCDGYKPSEKCMAALDLAWHVASADHMFLSGIGAGEFSTGDGKRPESLATGKAISAWYSEAVGADLAKLHSLAPEDCAKPINFHNVWTMPAAAWVQLALTHGIHHRGQLTSYLRPMGGKVPAIYGGSADEPMNAAQSA